MKMHYFFKIFSVSLEDGSDKHEVSFGDVPIASYCMNWFYCSFPLPLLIFMHPRSKIGGILFLSCLSYCPPLWNFNLDNIYWTVSARILIFHMSISCDKTFPLVPLLVTMWPRPWSCTHCLKTLSLIITFKPWVLKLWYFT